MDLVLDAALGEQLLLVDAHEGVAIDSGDQHVVRVNAIFLSEGLQNRF